LRRFCLQDQLEASDIAELTALRKDGAAALPLVAEHVKDAAAAVRGVQRKPALLYPDGRARRCGGG